MTSVKILIFSLVASMFVAGTLSQPTEMKQAKSPYHKLQPKRKKFIA